MQKTVTCECGWTFTGEEEALIAAIQAHGREVHDMEVTREQALAQASPA
jgi:predicted small metal-binding protein